MPYVVRNTIDPHYDIQRNWSAWMYPNADTAYGVAALVLGDVRIPRDLAAALGVDYRRVQSGEVFDCHDLWQETPCNHRAVFEQVVVELCGLDIRYNESWRQWQHCHHEGLACWRLEAETDAEALAEATAQGDYAWFGFGDQTIGAVRYVGAITETLHVFACDDVCTESDM